MAQMRLQRFLAQAGVAARRKAERLIVDGVVKVNGKVVTVLGTKVDPASDEVTVDGMLVEREAPFYALLNKPKACVTTVSDPENRPTVMDYVFGVPKSVVPVGRLDFYTEGVLLLTNDGALSAALLSPQRHVEKTYHLKIRGRMRDEHVVRMRRGVRLDDGRTTRSAQVDRLKSKSVHDWLVVTLTEGRSRQIHRMCEALGYQVVKLQRVAFGGIGYEGLRVGDARELTWAEVIGLYEQVGLALPRKTSAGGEWRVTREQTASQRRIRRLARASDQRARDEEPDGQGGSRTGAESARPSRSGAPSRGRSGDRPDRSGAPSRGRPGDRSGRRPSASPRSRPGDRSGRPGASSRSRPGDRPGRPGASSRSRPGDRPGRPGASSRSRPGDRSGRPSAKPGGRFKSGAPAKARRGGAKGVSRGTKPPKRGRR